MPTPVTPRTALKKFVKIHGTQRAAAEALGCSQAHVCDLLKGRRGFTDAMLVRLGLQRVSTIIPQSEEAPCGTNS